MRGGATGADAGRGRTRTASSVATRASIQNGRMVDGRVTRGTTGVNRLRRMDRFIAAHPAWRHAAVPHAVDLGYGAAWWTARELLARLRTVRSDARVTGIEIEPARVRRAREQAEAARAAGEPGLDGLQFVVGGFEVPLPGGERPAVIRAANVLRQYDEAEVARAWDSMLARLAPGGLLVEGTSNEVGRVASWVSLRPETGPESFTIALNVDALGSGDVSGRGGVATEEVLPSIVAERLPKVLIHRNVAGEGVHELLRALDDQWLRAAPVGTFSARQRWIAAVRGLRDAGWPVRDGVARWRLGELTVDWSAVAPR